MFFGVGIHTYCWVDVIRGVGECICWSLGKISYCDWPPMGVIMWSGSITSSGHSYSLIATFSVDITLSKIGYD